MLPLREYLKKNNDRYINKYWSMNKLEEAEYSCMSKTSNWDYCYSQGDITAKRTSESIEKTIDDLCYEINGFGYNPQNKTLYPKGMSQVAETLEYKKHLREKQEREEEEKQIRRIQAIRVEKNPSAEQKAKLQTMTRHDSFVKKMKELLEEFKDFEENYKAEAMKRLVAIEKHNKTLTETIESDKWWDKATQLVNSKEGRQKIKNLYFKIEFI